MALYAKPHFIWAFYLIGLLVWSHPTSAFADQNNITHPWSLLEHHREQILQLSSDDDALAFFRSINASQAKPSHTRGKSSQPSYKDKWSEEMKKAIPAYLASLAVTVYARTVRTSLIEPTTPPPSSDIIPGEHQLQWIMKQSPLQTLESVANLFKQVSSWSRMTTRPLSSDDSFADFASYYDRTYPDSDKNSHSWTSLFEQHGQKGIEARLLEYWQASDQAANPQVFPQSTHDAYAQQYIQTRLLPMFQSALLFQAIRLEATGYETAWKSWHDIQQWQQELQTQSATARLCGTWRWIVHNHQNHGDHKGTVTFSPPGESSSSLIQPTTIKIQGDTVYLKWTFPQGIQEDSLLLSNHDTHLEGTFKNSFGPHGSISGKRLSSCQS